MMDDYRFISYRLLEHKIDAWWTVSREMFDKIQLPEIDTHACPEPDDSIDREWIKYVEIPGLMIVITTHQEPVKHD